MRTTMIRLPDGREITSGAQAETAVFSSKLTQSVNDSKELNPGSVCAAMLELDLWDPQGSVQLQQGQEIRAYEMEDGETHPLGVFRLEKPERPSPNLLRLTAYDRVSGLDKDLTDWLAGLESWPYPLQTFAGMVCQACGLTLTNNQIPNGDYQVQVFTAQGITGRKLMQWVGQIAGRFCYASAEGSLTFGWYTPSNVTLTPGGEHPYFQGGLRYEDYQVAKIEKVHLGLTRDDVGVSWPQEDGEKNTYRIIGNYLLTTTDSATLLPVAQNLYEELKNFTYTPCKVQLPACGEIRAGQRITVTDPKGNTFETLVMTKTREGQKDILESTGSHRRDSSTAVNNEDFRTVNSKLMELQKDAEGLSVTVSQQQQELTAVSQSVADVRLRSDELSAQILQVESTVTQSQDSVNSSLETLTKEVSAKMNAEGVQLQIQTALENGTEKVVTKTGFTFDEAGLTVEKSGSEMKTQITENGMVVSQNGQDVLTANNQGVDARNLHATTYLLVGANSRFEDYGGGRTGCFWIGGT